MYLFMYSQCRSNFFLLSSNILKKRVKTAFDENVHEAKDVEIHNENIQKELMKNLGMGRFLK